MPAEIDTGGPTVLHCDYRADCPIPIVLSAFAKEYAAKNQEERLPVQSSLAPRHKIDGFNRPVDERRNRRDSYRRRREETHYRKREKILSSSKGSHSFAAEAREAHERQVPPWPLLRQCESPSGETCDNRDYLKTATTVETAPFALIERRLPLTDATKPTSLDGRTCSRPQAGPVSSHAKDNTSATRSRSAENFRQVDAYGESPLFSSHRSHAVSRCRSSRGRDPPRDFAIAETRSEDEEPSESSRLSCADESARNDRRADVAANNRRRNCWKSRNPPSERKRRPYVSAALLLLLALFGQNGLLKTCVLNSGARLTLFAIGTVINVANAAPVDLIGDAGIRAERSANLSHITGASRKIQMYIKNRHLQILPDGTVNGSNDDTSEYTIFQRTSVSRGQLRIQGVATCLYLCMDSCGLLYGSREYTEDCVFNETLEQHNYNTYSSVRWSTAKKTLYLGLNRRGQPRRVQAKGHNLGRLSAYARVLTQMAPPDRVEALQRRMLGAEHNVRHRHSGPAHHHHRAESGVPQTVCPNLPAQEKDGRDRFRCRKRKKRKKRKRRCRAGEEPGPQCEVPERSGGSPSSGINMPAGAKGNDGGNGTLLESKRSCESAASEEACRREALSASSKKRKSRIEEQKQHVTRVVDELIAPSKARNSSEMAVVRGRNEETGRRGGQTGGTKKQKSRGDGEKNEQPSTGQSGSRTRPRTEPTVAVGQSGDGGEEEQDDWSNGKNKAHEARSSAKKPKIAVAGNNSQSKKPDLTDGKKRKRKGTAPRGSGASHRQKQSATRKRFAAGGTKERKDDASAATGTTVRPSTASSSSWPRPGASNSQSAPRGKLAFHRRKTKTPSSPRNDVTSSTSDRTIDPTMFLGSPKTQIPPLEATSASNRPTNSTFVAVSTTPADRQSITKVPATLPDRLSPDASSSSSSSTAISVLETENNPSDGFLEPSASSVEEDEDEDRSTFLSNDYTTANDSSVLDSGEDIAGSSTVGTVGLDGTSVESVEDEDGDTPFDPSKAILQASTAKTHLERLAM